MNVLMITGDKKFGPGNPRFELQRSVVDGLTVVYWGRGSMFPKIPNGMFDVVTAQDPFWRGLFARRAARKLAARLNIQVHADLRGQSLIKRALARFVLRRADSIRVVSEKIKAQVEAIGVRAPITVLPVYVDAAKFGGAAHLPHDGKNIVWVGRFEPEKNPLAAIEVLKSVRSEVKDAKLVMLGSGGLEGVMRTAAKGLPVEFPGWQDPVPYLQTADVVLSTSRHESWGQSMVEALAAGVPVVASDVGIAKEAGAIVAARSNLTLAIIEVLRSGVRGELKIKLPSAAEWAVLWKKSL
jgi:glycosyltransferase involved in cell wall biosynthesis